MKPNLSLCPSHYVMIVSVEPLTCRMEGLCRLYCGTLMGGDTVLLAMDEEVVMLMGGRMITLLTGGGGSGCVVVGGCCTVVRSWGVHTIG